MECEVLTLADTDILRERHLSGGEVSEVCWLPTGAGLVVAHHAREQLSRYGAVDVLLPMSHNDTAVRRDPATNQAIRLLKTERPSAFAIAPDSRVAFPEAASGPRGTEFPLQIVGPLGVLATCGDPQSESLRYPDELRFSDDGHFLFSQENGYVTAWDATGARLTQFAARDPMGWDIDPVLGCVYVAAVHHFPSYEPRGYVECVSVHAREAGRMWAMHPGVIAVRVHPQKRLIATCSAEDVRIWGLDTGNILGRAPLPKRSSPHWAFRYGSLDFNPSGDMLMIVDSHQIMAYRIRPNGEIGLHGVADTMMSGSTAWRIRFSPVQDVCYILNTCSESGSLITLDVSRLRE